MKSFLGPIGLQSIRDRFLLLALAAALVPVVTLEILSNQRARQTWAQTRGEELQATAGRTAAELDLWVDGRVLEVQRVAQALRMASPTGQIQLSESLAAARSNSVGVVGLAVVGSDGTLLAANAGLDGVPQVAEIPEVSDERIGPAFGLPYVNTTSGTVVVDVATPFPVPGDPDATLVTAVSLDGFRARFVALFFAEDGSRMRVVDPNGRIVFDSRGRGSLGSEIGSVVELFAGGEPGYAIGDDAGVRTLAAWATSSVLRWDVVVGVPTEAAYARIADARRASLLFIAGVLLFVFIAASFSGNLIVRPLQRLSAGARVVASGDLTVRLPVRGHDELAVLTGIFNEMVQNLRESRAELDQLTGVLQEQNAELARISVTDALTLLFNRRYVMQQFEKEIERARRSGRPLSVLMLDVDQFKQYNDSYGHPAGDGVLVAMGQVMRDATREVDIPARYGGEEFIVILPECDLQGAVEAGERVRAALAKEDFEGRVVTVSIGAAQYGIHGSSPTDLIASADEALYEAKQQGRDRVVASTSG